MHARMHARTHTVCVCMYAHDQYLELPFSVKARLPTYKISVYCCKVHFCSDESKQQRLNKLPKDEEGPVNDVLGVESPLPADASHKGDSEDGECSCPNEPRVVVEYQSLCSKEGKKCQTDEKYESVSDNGAFFLRREREGRVGRGGWGGEGEEWRVRRW